MMRKCLSALFAICLIPFGAAASDEIGYFGSTPRNGGMQSAGGENNAAGSSPLKGYLALKGGYSRSDTDGSDYNRAMLGFAVGAYAMPQVRAELEVMFNERIRDNSVFGSYSQDTAGFLANLYYDFGTGKVRPYVGAGFGFSVFKDKASGVVRGLFGRYGYIEKSETELGFAGALHAGVSAELSRSVALDAGVRYTYMYRPETDLFDSYDSSVFSGLVSFRFNF